MPEFIVILPAMLVADVLSPVMVATVVYGLGARSGVRSMGLMLLALLFVRFFTGVGIAFVMSEIAQKLHIPELLQFITGAVIGVLLLVGAIALLRGSNSVQSEPEAQGDVQPMDAYKSVRLAFYVTAISVPLAVPYLAWIDILLHAGLSVAESMFWLFVYNLAYVLPFFGLVWLAWRFKEQSREPLEKVADRMNYLGARLAPVLLIAVAVLLIQDAVCYAFGFSEWSLMMMMGI